MFKERAHLHRVEPLAPRHCADASAVLRQAFPDDLLAALGDDVVQAFLESFVRQPGGVGFVGLCADSVVGFVVGAENASRHRAMFMGRVWRRLLRRALLRALTRPSLAWRLARCAAQRLPRVGRLVTRRRKFEWVERIPPASLIMLGVAPEHRRQGVADGLTSAFLAELARRGAADVKLAVETNNEPAVAFYRTRGWHPTGLFPAPDGWVYRLVYDLAALRSRIERSRTEVLARGRS